MGFGLRRLVSRVARSAFPFVRLEKIIFIALLVSLVTAMEGAKHVPAKICYFWKKLDSCGSWFHDFIVKSRVANMSSTDRKCQLVAPLSGQASADQWFSAFGAVDLLSVLPASI